VQELAFFKGRAVQSYCIYSTDLTEILFHAVILNVVGRLFTLLSQLFVVFHPRKISDSVRSALFLGRNTA
jgi:hypothetical protein